MTTTFSAPSDTVSAPASDPSATAIILLKQAMAALGQSIALLQAQTDTANPPLHPNVPVGLPPNGLGNSGNIMGAVAGPGPLYPPGTNQVPPGSVHPHVPDVTVSTNEYGIVFKLTHKAAQELIDSIPNVSQMISMAASAHPMFATASTIVGAFLAINAIWIANADQGQGVYLTSLWFPTGLVVVGPV